MFEQINKQLRSCGSMSSSLKKSSGGFLLDRLGGITASGCVFAKSLYLLTRAYTGPCILVQRQSDNAVLDIGFSGGYVDIAAIENFCMFTNGYVRIFYDQLGGSDAIQTTLANMPIICTAGVFDVLGIKYLSAQSSYMDIADYAAINFTNQILSIYCNFYVITNTSAPIIARRDTAIQYAVYLSGDNLSVYLENDDRLATAYTKNAIQKVLIKWQKTANGLVVNINNTVNSGTFNFSPLTNEVYTCMGAKYNIYPATNTYFNGYINTVLMFNTNQIDNYTLIASKC